MAVAMSKAQAGTGPKRAQMLIDGSWVEVRLRQGHPG